MTPQDSEAFNHAFNRLAVALREPTSDAVTKRVYFDALAGLSLDAVQQAARQMEQTLVSEDGSKSFFPTTAQWHKAATEAQQAIVRQAIQPRRDEPWHFECGDCEDTGWVPRICRPGARCGCLLYQGHQTYEHSYTARCPCQATNHTYRRRRNLPDLPVSADEAERSTERVRRRDWTQAIR